MLAVSCSGSTGLAGNNLPSHKNLLFLPSPERRSRFRGGLRRSCFVYPLIAGSSLKLRWALGGRGVRPIWRSEGPIVASISVAAAFLGVRALRQASQAGRQTWQVYKESLSAPRARRFFPGGFEPVMTRREAALILGVRGHTVEEKIKEAHKKAMVANHPDAGGSHYLASKINEAKQLLLGKTKGDSVF